MTVTFWRYVDGFPFFDGNFFAVDGKSIFDGIFTAVTQHDGKFLAVDGKSIFDGIITALTQHDRRQTVFVFLAPQVSGFMPNTYLVHEHKLKRGSPRLDHKSCSPVIRQRLTFYFYIV